MKTLFNSLFFLFFSVSFCFGLDDDSAEAERFFNSVQSSYEEIKKLEIHSLLAKRPNFNSPETLLYFSDEQYFGKKRKLHHIELLKACDLLYFAYEAVKDFWEDILLKKDSILSSKKEDISTYALQCYCAYISLIKNIYEEKSSCVPDSFYAKDLEKALQSLSFCDDFLGETGKTIVSALSLLRIKTDEIGLNHYRVFLNKKFIIKKMQKQIKNIALKYNIIEKNFNLIEKKIDDLEISHKITKQFREYISSGKENLEEFSKQFESSAIEVSERNLAISVDSQEMRKIEHFVKSQEYINNHQKNLFGWCFMDDSGPECLTLEQQEKTRKLFNEIFEEQFLQDMNSSVTSSAVDQKSKGKVKQKKKGKKRKYVKKGKGKKETTSKKIPSIGPSMNHKEEEPSVLFSKNFSEEEKNSCLKNSASEMTLSNLTAKDVSDVRSEKREEKEEKQEELDAEEDDNFPRSSSSTTSSSSSFCALDDLERVQRDENLEIVTKSLNSIITKTEKNSGNFSLFLEAKRLQALLETGPEFLEQVQGAIVNLAQKLQMFNVPQSSSTISSSFIKVPENLEGTFLYFMETPVKHLNGQRFGMVRTLFENLGITIDDQRNGSRIAFSFNDKKGYNHKTSIHLHDKLNGPLEAGRINSLRQFLIDCGFIYSE